MESGKGFTALPAGREISASVLKGDLQQEAYRNIHYTQYLRKKMKNNGVRISK